jgi:hypothetical protein
MAGLAHMMTDSSQAVLKITDLAGMLASEDMAVFTTRMRILELARSLHIMPIDTTEGFEYVERSFAGVADVVDRITGALAGSAAMPQTALFGASPAGLNATGASDTRGWYDQIQAARTSTYQRPLESLVYLAAVVTGASSPDAWGVSWPSLWQSTPDEEAARRKLIADTDVAYIAAGVVLEDEVAMTRFGGDGYSDGPIQIDAEMRDALRAQDLARAVEGPPAEAEPTEAEPAEAVDPTTALNGAQVSALLEIVQGVVQGQIPRESAVEIIAGAFPLSTAEADRILGAVGRGFVPTPPETDPEPAPPVAPEEADDENR